MQPEGRGELQVVAVAVPKGDEAGVVRVEFDAVVVPHGELRFGVVAVAAPRGGISGPGFVRVEPVQASLELPRSEALDLDLEVSADVIGVRFRFDERPVEEDGVDSHLPELSDEDLGLTDEVAQGPSRGKAGVP